MREIVVLIMVGGALIFSVLAYQRVEELSDAVYRLSAQANQEAFQRNRVMTLGQQLEKLLRPLKPSDRKASPAAQ